MRTLFVTLLVLTCLVSVCIWITSQKTGLTHIELVDKDKLNAVFSTMDSRPGLQKAILSQLNVDYLFMAFCFSGIAVLCFMARKRASDIMDMKKLLLQPLKEKGIVKLFMVLALLQVVAWGLDVWENSKLETWVHNKSVGNDHGMLQIIVTAKFVLSVTGFVAATVYLFVTIKKHRLLKDAIKTNDAQKEKLVKMAA